MSTHLHILQYIDQSPTHRGEKRTAKTFKSGDSNIAHSEDNILRWMKYLPQDCIETMIRMGWDVST